MSKQIWCTFFCLDKELGRREIIKCIIHDSKIPIYPMYLLSIEFSYINIEISRVKLLFSFII